MLGNSKICVKLNRKVEDKDEKSNYDITLYFQQKKKKKKKKKKYYPF